MKISKHTTGRRAVRWLDGLCEGHDYPNPPPDGRRMVVNEPNQCFRRNCWYCWRELRQGLGMEATDG